MFPTANFSSPRSVLIVDESDESREVLRTALELRGYTIHEAERADSGLELAQLHAPGVIVFDADNESAAGAGDRFAECSSTHDAQLVVLGTISRVDPPSEHRHNVRKPYHYGPLILKIEELLQQSQSGDANSSTGPPPTPQSS